MNSTTHIGKAGEFRVLSELILRGHDPALKVVDNGIDIILENGKTIQVKTVTKPLFDSKKSGRVYVVTLSSARYKKGKQSPQKNNLKTDFMIAWLIQNDVFYIIPCKEIKGGKSVSLGYGISKYEKFRNNWEVVK